MVQTPAKPETATLLLNIPSTLRLQVSPAQFAALAAVNHELQLERTAQGELIVTPQLAGKPANATGALRVSYTSGGEMQVNRGKPLIPRPHLLYRMARSVPQMLLG